MKHYVIPSSTYHKLKSIVGEVEDEKEKMSRKNPNAPEEVEVGPEVDDLEFISGSFPKSTRERALRLVNYIKRHGSKIVWSTRNGIVSVDGHSIPGSNIIDLLRTAISFTTNKPEGWSRFGEALKEINVPASLIAHNPPGTPVRKTEWLTH